MGECRATFSEGVSLDRCEYPGVAKTYYWGPFNGGTCCYCCYNDWCSEVHESGCATEASWWDDLKRRREMLELEAGSNQTRNVIN
jgi:hypothetical protein